jgi:hypothetical protein
MTSPKRLLILALFATNLSPIIAQANPGNCDADDGKLRTTKGKYIIEIFDIAKRS